MPNTPGHKLHEPTSFSCGDPDIANFTKLPKDLLQFIFRDIWVQVANKYLQCNDSEENRKSKESSVNLSTNRGVVNIIICWDCLRYCCRVNCSWIHGCCKITSLISIDFRQNKLKNSSIGKIINC